MNIRSNGEMCNGENDVNYAIRKIRSHPQEIAELKARINELETAKLEKDNNSINLGNLTEIGQLKIKQEHDRREIDALKENIRLKDELTKNLLRELEAAKPKDDSEYEFKIEGITIIKDKLYYIINIEYPFLPSCINVQDGKELHNLVTTLQKVLDDGVLKS